MNIDAPQTGSIYDMEEMDLQSKLIFLKSNELLKCMNRKELLDEHERNWQVNGLNTFRTKVEFRVLQKRHFINDFCVIYSVELALNGHWSDSCCGETDKQY
jgi:hypothetical protein